MHGWMWPGVPENGTGLSRLRHLSDIASLIIADRLMAHQGLWLTLWALLTMRLMIRGFFLCRSLWRSVSGSLGLSVIDD